MQFLDTDFDERVFKELRNASSVSRKDSPIKVGGSLLDSWRDHITSSQIAKAIEILGLFGLDRIYSQNSLPNVDEAYRLLTED
jgi:hypothetical protein